MDYKVKYILDGVERKKEGQLGFIQYGHSIKLGITLAVDTIESMVEQKPNGYLREMARLTEKNPKARTTHLMVDFETIYFIFNGLVERKLNTHRMRFTKLKHKLPQIYCVNFSFLDHQS